MRKTKGQRLTTAERIADMLKEFASCEDLTIAEIAEIMGIGKNSVYGWTDAFEEVGLIEKGQPRRNTSAARGSPAATYKLAKWVREKISTT